MKILNFGSLNLDYVYTVDHMVTGGETIATEKMEVFCGGKGLNQSIALKRAGVEVYHAGCIGLDGKMLLDACREDGVDTRFIRMAEEKSGHTIIQVDKKGQNSILLYGGANRAQERKHIDKVISFFSAGDMLLLQNEINELPYLMDTAYGKGMKIVLNPSPYDACLRKCDLAKVSLFLLNEVEAAQITGISDEEGMAEKVVAMFPEAEVVLTLGEKGSLYLSRDLKLKQEIYQVPVVDTTAAGDTFTGYFLAAEAEGLSIRDALARASKASAVAVGRRGAVPSIPFRDEVLGMEI